MMTLDRARVGSSWTGATLMLVAPAEDLPKFTETGAQVATENSASYHAPRFAANAAQGKARQGNAARRQWYALQ
jgi:hypothetical protein